MWPRLRLDIGWRDLGRGFIDLLLPGDRQTVQRQLESTWAGAADDALACFSVRTGFDLFLQSLDLPTGSEVLFSAVNIPDMPRIAQHHGLVPVPVDVSGMDFHLDVVALHSAITPRTRVLVVAHLLGARPGMDEILEVAERHGLIVVEDCAQAWFSQSSWHQ